jgi:hypothetical protein
MKTAVSQMIKELQEQFPKEMGDMYERNQLLLEDIALRAKEMEKEQNISLLEWIRNNAVEVQGGWQHDGWTYTDKEILEVYYKKQEQ